MNDYRILISEDEISERVAEIAQALNEEFRDKNPVLIGVLKGAVIFYSELLKKLEFPLEVEFIKARSYEKTESTGSVVIEGSGVDLNNKDIIVIEDIVDTGRTLEAIISLLENEGANSITTVTLLDKPERRKVEIHPDYAGFIIEDTFVVGYGLDYEQKMRNLPYIATLDSGKENY